MFSSYQALGPMLRTMEPEAAHRITISALKSGLVPRAKRIADPALAMHLWGLEFDNPVGMAAGFDKSAEVPDALIGQGFGFVEVGTLTPRAQSGNPKPRVFRLRREHAMINRLGFNNEGIDSAVRRLARRQRTGPGIVGVNIGANKDSDDRIADYARAVPAVARYADYLVVNVSSPNTPGLRALQSRAELEDLLSAVLDARPSEGAGADVPVLLKIAPDLTPQDIRDIARVALASGIDGLIATNTTIDRPKGLKGGSADEAGGLSGPPLFDRSTEVLSEMYRLTKGKLPLIGIGGISNGADAYAKIRAGASLVQLYTALIYAGPGLISEIVHDLGKRLRADGFDSLADAVGTDHR